VLWTTKFPVSAFQNSFFKRQAYESETNSLRQVIQFNRKFLEKATAYQHTKTCKLLKKNQVLIKKAFLNLTRLMLTKFSLVDRSYSPKIMEL
jgi:predicted nucleotide-binding protein (sugar kinase/HSP70/actin superfamily)